MAFQVSQCLDGRISRNNQAYRVTLEDRCHVNDLQVFTTRHQCLIPTGKDEGIVAQHHRADQVRHYTMMEADIQASSFIVSFTLRHVEWRELYIWDVAQPDRNFFQPWPAGRRR